MLLEAHAVPHVPEVSVHAGSEVVVPAVPEVDALVLGALVGEGVE